MSKRRASKHSQTRSALSGPLPFAAMNLLGALVAGVVWLYLTQAAIDFAGVALDGDTRGWKFLIGPALGALFCLVLVLAFVARALVALGIISDYTPRRAGARRRAK